MWSEFKHFAESLYFSIEVPVYYQREKAWENPLLLFFYLVNRYSLMKSKASSQVRRVSDVSSWLYKLYYCFWNGLLTCYRQIYFTTWLTGVLIVFRAYIWLVYLVIKVLKSLGALRMIPELPSLPPLAPPIPHDLANTPVLWLCLFWLLVRHSI